MKEQFLQRMKNILLCYSTRNTTVGYCQGMNFLVARLLLIMDDEEKVFWLFIQIMENILSLLNYQELTGIIVETTLIETLIEYYLPELNKYLIEREFALTTSNFIHKWIVCLFAQTLKPEMIYTLYDFFFIDGFITMIKASIFILASIQQEILAQDTFAEIYSIFTDVENKVTNPKNMIFFICQKKFNMTKDDLIEFTKRLEVPIVNKMKDGELKSGVRRTAEEINALLKRKNIYCDPNWPFCLYEPSTFNIKEFFIVKENKAPFIIEDYYYIKNRGYQDDINDIIDGVIDTDKTTNKEILIERHKHICDDQKIVEISQNFSKLENVLSNEHVDKISDKSQEMKIYELLKTFKDVDTIINYIKEQLKKKEEKIVLKEKERKEKERLEKERIKRDKIEKEKKLKERIEKEIR